MSWTDERVMLLKKLWIEGKTAAEIAKLIGGGRHPKCRYRQSPPIKTFRTHFSYTGKYSGGYRKRRACWINPAQTTKIRAKNFCTGYCCSRSYPDRGRELLLRRGSFSGGFERSHVPLANRRSQRRRIQILRGPCRRWRILLPTSLPCGIPDQYKKQITDRRIVEDRSGCNPEKNQCLICK